MNLRDMHRHIEIQLGETLPYASFFIALRRVLKRINIHAEKEEMFIVPTGGLEPDESELPQEPYIRVENPIETDIYDLGEFIAITDGESIAKSYFVGGLGYSLDLEILPPAGFEVSLNEITWYGSDDDPLTIPYETANDYMTEVFVKFVPGATITSNITHSSGNISRTLAVTGTAVELPHASDRLFDFQGDSGIIVSGTDVTNWESSIGTRVLDSDMSSNYKTPEIGSILNGIQSVRLGRKRDVYTYEYGGMADDLLLGDNSSTLTFTIAGVFTVNNLSGTSIIMYPFCANYQPTAGLTCSAGHLYIGGTDIGIIAQGVPYSIVYTCDFVGNVLTYCLNSLEVVSVSYTTGNPSPLNYLPGGIGAVTGGFTYGAIADIHAFIGWRKTTVFSESDYIRTMQYLMLKYGLT